MSIWVRRLCGALAFVVALAGALILTALGGTFGLGLLVWITVSGVVKLAMVRDKFWRLMHVLALLAWLMANATFAHAIRGLLAGTHTSAAVQFILYLWLFGWPLLDFLDLVTPEHDWKMPRDIYHIR